MKEYKKRVADQILLDKLESSGAVLIEGPRHQQFPRAGLEPFPRRMLPERISRADPGQDEQQRHEPGIQNVHYNVLVLRILRILAEAAYTAEHALVIVEVNDVV